MCQSKSLEGIPEAYWHWQSQCRRPTWDEFFMMQAEVCATRSTCDRGPEARLRPSHKGTGAVIATANNRLVSMGYNGSAPGDIHCDDVDHPQGGHLMVEDHCIRTLHAEENAIINATKSTDDCVLYSTTMPCFDCAKRVIAAGIKRVVYQDWYVSRNTEQVAKLFERCSVILDCIEM